MYTDIKQKGEANILSDPLYYVSVGFNTTEHNFVLSQ